MRASTIAAVIGALSMSVGCSDATGPRLDEFVISGRVTGIPEGVPLGNVRIMLTRFILSPAPGGSGTTTYASTTTDPSGHYEMRAEVNRLECNGSSLSIETSHPNYYQVGLIEVDCSSQTVDVELLLKPRSVRIDPAGGAVEAGSETSFLATVTTADGATSTTPGLWDIRWQIEPSMESREDCGTLDNSRANPVLFTAPAVPPEQFCSLEGGADVALSVTIGPGGVRYGPVTRRILVTVQDP